MKIEEVKIHNWRSIRDETISFENLMILIGQNNHGKSNILSAILFFFGEIGLDPLDFCIETDDLYIEIQFALLDENDQTTFKKYLTASNTMRIRKMATKQNGFSYHGYVESPTEDWLQEDNISNYTKREIAEQLPLAHFLPKSGRITKDIFREVQVRYIQERKDTLTF